MKKQFVNNQDSFTAICGYCGTSKRVPITERVLCMDVCCITCGQITPVQLCYRKHFRKQTDIEGVLIYNTHHWPIKITNMSIRGYQLVFPKPHMPNIGNGDICVLKYQLPNKNKTQISEEVEIKTCDHKNGLCGVLVIDLQPYSKIQKAKGFWLMP